MDFTDIGKMDTSILTYITILIYYMTLQCKIIMNIFEKSETRHTKRKSDGKTNQWVDLNSETNIQLDYVWD